MNVKKLLAIATLAVTPAIMAADAPKTPAPAPAKPAEAKPEPAAPVIKMTAADIDKLFAAIPEVIATYGKDKKVTRSELSAILRPQLEAAAQQGADIKLEQILPFAADFANKQAMQAILIEEALKKGFKPDAEEAKKQLEGFKQQQGADNFTATLAKLNMTEEKLLKNLSETAMIPKMIKSLAPLDPKEIKDFYDKNLEQFTLMKASHILAMFPGVREGKAPSKEEEAEALERIKNAQKALAEGKKFDEVAKSASDCPSKEKGGDLGEFSKGQMVPEFEAALLKLQKDQISEPVKTQFGYHLIKSGGIKTVSFDEAKKNIEEYLLNQKMDEAAAKLIERLVKEQNLQVLVKLPTPPAPPAPAPAPAQKAPEAKPAK